MAQKFERLIQEDLNIGTGRVWISAPASGQLRATQIGVHSVARGQKAYEASWTPGAIASGSNASTTVTVPDAAVGDFVMASHSKILTNDLRIFGHVSATDTVKVVVHNPTSAAITVPAGTAKVIVFPVVTATTPSPAFSVTWTVEETEGGIVGESWTYVFTSVVVGGTAPYTYSWDMGDGQPPNTNANPTQVWSRGAFSNPASITVTLTVTDDTLATAVYDAVVVVTFNE